MVIFFVVYLVLFFFFLMNRRPPRSTRTDTLFPYPTLFRSGGTAFEGRHPGCKENRCQIPRRPGHTTLARAKAAGLTGRYPLHVQEAVEADRSESMNLKISGHHVDVTDPMREYVLTKLKRIERHFDHLISAEVILSVEKLNHRAEATIHASGADLHAEATLEDMRSEEHTSELQSLMRISYAVFCLKKKTLKTNNIY